MSRLTRLIAFTRLNSSESATLPTVVSVRHRHVLTGSTVSFAPRRQLSYTRGDRSKFTTSFRAPSAFHTHAPEPEDFHYNPAVERFGNEEASEVLAVRRRGRSGRKELLEELMRNVMKLTCASVAEGGVCEVYVVGTVHYSEESCEQVRAIINFLKPKVVFVELCDNRLSLLYQIRYGKIKMPTIVEIVNAWKKDRDTFGAIMSWFSLRFHFESKVDPVSEFEVVGEVVSEYEGQVMLGDRPVEITKKRTWRKMPLLDRIQFLYAFLHDVLVQGSLGEPIKKSLKLDDSNELGKWTSYFPTLAETMVHERDRYMSTALLDTAQKHSTLVAVVGRGHLRGIKKNWMKSLSYSEIQELLEIPPEKLEIKILASLGVAVVGTAIVAGIYFICK